MKKMYGVTVWYEADSEAMVVFGKDKTDAIKNTIKVLECRKQEVGKYVEAVSITVNQEISNG